MTKPKSKRPQRRPKRKSISLYAQENPGKVSFEDNALEQTAKEYDWMPEARQLATQCWCDEETEDRVMDTVLAEAVATRIAAWMDSAAEFCRNMEFYRGIIWQIGEMFGDAAKTSDDGSIQDHVLVLKVPELVAKLLPPSPAPVAAAEKNQGIKDPSKAGDDQTQKDGISPGVAFRLLAIREALIRGSIDDAFHELYALADNSFESLTPWIELEGIAAGKKPSVAEPNAAVSPPVSKEVSESADTARLEAALNISNADVLENWRADYESVREQRDTWKAAFDEVEGQRNSLVTELGTLRNLIAAEIDDAHKLVGDELPLYCDCGHRKERHDSSIGRCRAPGCDCTAMLQWRPR